MNFEEFRAEVPDTDLDDLQRRLDSTRWPDQLPDVGWSYGVELERLREVAEHWRTAYDWRRFEARLNAYPQYVTEIDRQRVHYLRAGSSGTPLLLLHGWPGAGADYLDVIDALAQDWQLVVPTMPGFGFSGPTRATGWDVERIARAWAALMEGLGYERYGVHGYDWGGRVGAALARMVPERVIGLHLDGYLAFPQGEELTEDEQRRLGGLDRWQQERSGYASIQSTRPQTLAYGLVDSPVGQLAWNLEWFDDYGHRVGAIGNDRILDSVTLTWCTGTGGSSGRIYREAQDSWTAEVEYCPVAAGLAVFPGDSTVRRLVEREFDVVHCTEFDRGGHFAALEVPELVVEDLQAFFAKL